MWAAKVQHAACVACTGGSSPPTLWLRVDGFRLMVWCVLDSAARAWVARSVGAEDHGHQSV